MNINENTVLPGFIAWLICSCNLGFNFGTIRPGGINKALKDNVGLTDDNGNSEGVLQVTDYRTADDASQPDSAAGNLGYTVTAQLGEFIGKADPDLTSGSKFTTAAGTTATPAFVMTLNQVTGNTTVTGPVDKDSTQATLEAGGPEAKVLGFNADEGSYGQTTINYKAANAASLKAPANVTAGSYDAAVTWTLNAAASSNE
ncbi:hypothetical protein [Loigolactobacillus zhaoyuanensis]|uniref:WxL domain-containing protein n=1 Tax=Loigolactobacillus zhaoyuanensis TaxID=2486017 RepID=A0ABW8UEP1_9LACO